MHIGFKIVLEDNSIIESHSPVWNQVKDHKDALPPNNDKKWKSYSLVTDDGNSVLADFVTGLFVINGQNIHPADDTGFPLTHLKKPQKFEDVGPKWRFLNGLNYFPIAGRRTVKGDRVDKTLPFVGWKINFRDKIHTKICFIYPNGEVVMQ
jgi:hypothetical protein